MEWALPCGVSYIVRFHRGVAQFYSRARYASVEHTEGTAGAAQVVGAECTWSVVARCRFVVWVKSGTNTTRPSETALAVLTSHSDVDVEKGTVNWDSDSWSLLIARTALV